MGSVEQPLEMVTTSKNLLVYTKRQRKARLEDINAQANKVLEALLPNSSLTPRIPDDALSIPEVNDPRQPPENDDDGDEQQQQQENGEKLGKPEKRRTKSGKREEKSGKYQSVEQEAAAVEFQVDEAGKKNEATYQIESEEPGAPKPSKPKIGFERRRKRELQTEEKAPPAPEEPVTRKKGRPRKIRPVPEGTPVKLPVAKEAPETLPVAKEVPDKEEEDDDETLEAAKSRRRRGRESRELELEQELCGAQEEAHQPERPGEKSKASEPPSMKALKKCSAPKAAATPPSKKRVRGSEDGETLSIHEAAHEKAQSASGLSDVVYQWLTDLGLLKYAEHFEIHEVDDGVLPLLTFDDLREMGISAVGTRRKMFTSIQGMGKKPQDA